MIKAFDLSPSGLSCRPFSMYNCLTSAVPYMCGSRAIGKKAPGVHVVKNKQRKVLTERERERWR